MSDKCYQISGKMLYGVSVNVVDGGALVFADVGISSVDDDDEYWAGAVLAFDGKTGVFVSGYLVWSFGWRFKYEPFSRDDALRCIAAALAATIESGYEGRIRLGLMKLHVIKHALENGWYADGEPLRVYRQNAAMREWMDAAGIGRKEA